MLKTRARDYYWWNKDRCHERDVKCREHRKSCINTDTHPRPQAFSQRSISRQRRTHLLELLKIAKLSTGAKRVRTQTEGHAEIQAEQPQREPTRAPRTKAPPSMQPDTSVFSIAHLNHSSTSRLLAPDLTSSSPSPEDLGVIARPITGTNIHQRRCATGTPVYDWSGRLSATEMASSHHLKTSRHTLPYQQLFSASRRRQPPRHSTLRESLQLHTSTPTNPAALSAPNANATPRDSQPGPGIT